MAINIKTHTCFVHQHGTHPFVDTVNDLAGVLATDLVSWFVHGVKCNMLRFLNLTKHIVDEWLLYYLMLGHVLILMIKQTSTLSRKFVRLRNRCIDRGKSLLLLYIETLHIHADIKLRSECKWQPNNATSSYILDAAHEAYNRNLKFSNKIFTPPYECIQRRLKKPPDRIILAVYEPAWITLFHIIYVIIGLLKIWHLTLCSM